MPVSIGRLILIPRLRDFHARYPDIDLVIGLNDRPVDLVGEAVDCAIRVGELKDSSLIARRIGTFQCATAASPIYLEKYGEPTSIEDLQKIIKRFISFQAVPDATSIGTLWLMI